MSYLTRQSVREEAGFQEVETEALAGVADGTNQNFAASRTPIVDNTDDDVLGVADVLVRVNGVPVDVSEINGTTGLITLAVAPPEDAEITCQYASSALPDSYITKLITEAESMVNGSIRKYAITPLSEENPNYPRARRIAVLYAGGFALIRDYGKNTDTEETSKDGYEKLKTAKKLLEELMTDMKDNSDSSSTGGEAKTVSEGHIFNHHNGEDRTSHNYFMRKRC